MASILKRGEYSYQATIRRRGYPSKTKTFETKIDAVKWARNLKKSRRLAGAIASDISGCYFAATAACSSNCADLRRQMNAIDNSVSALETTI